MSSARRRSRTPGSRDLASAGALAWLASERSALEPPIRAERFDLGRFRQHGLSLGTAQSARVRHRRSAAFFPRLQDNIAVLTEAYRYIDAQALGGHAVSPAGEWLLDNFHLVAEQFKAVHDGLPLRYFRNLPVLDDAHLAGLPRVYGIAWALVAHTDSGFDEELLRGFLDAYQRSRELTLGELWALPTTLRVVLVENLRRLCERMAVTEAARELANGWCDRPDGALNPAEDHDPLTLFERMDRRGVGRAFALQVMQRLHSDAGALTVEGARGREAIRQALALALPDPVAAQAQESADEAADNLSVSRAITALRAIGHADWRGLISNTSALMRLVQTVPSFCAEHEITQDDSLHAIERFARRSGRGEIAVLEVVLRLMPEPGAAEGLSVTAASRVAREQTLGHWLTGAGEDRLRANLGLGPAWAFARSAAWRHGVLAAYLATVLVGTVALTVWAVASSDRGLSSSGLVGWLAGLLALWPASEAVLAVVNRLVSESVPPRGLPRMSLASGIPPEHRVLVVIPTMLTSPAGLRALVAQLERHHLANVEANAQFALLSDFADSPGEHADADAPLLAEAVRAIDELEARYRTVGAAATVPASSRRFLLLQRRRVWSESEQCWIGWERKRGKLEQLVALLSGHLPGAFIDLGLASTPEPGIPYVVTLDSDTVLPPGALRALVGVAAHPMNQPQFGPDGHEVVAGYGILQPRIAAPLASPTDGTPFHWLFAGSGGLDPYSAASSEVHQDLFGTGTFTGKGLLQVAAMQAMLGGRLPESQVLSHDLVEGAMARCGGVSDIALIEEAPTHADVAASRLHRWTRGDWQLLPLLWRAGRFGIGATDRWKMVDNLRRSLVAPFSAALLMWSLAGVGAGGAAPLSPWMALTLVALAFGAGSLLGALAGLVPHREHLAWQHFLGLALAELGRALGGTIWRLALLLDHAIAMADAVGRACWRMVVSHRSLLQWTTAAAAQASATHQWSGLLRRHAPVSAVAVVLLGALLTLRTPEPALAVTICMLWAGTPLWIWWASRLRARSEAPALSAPDQLYLRGVARDTWRLFEEHVNADSHHLPPDNVQSVPGLMVAQRTSPTNIGLYLLSLACAQRFGWVSVEQWLNRSERTLDTMDRLQRHRGHFLNWYDTRTLETLPPAYVSTVDSGNLCGHLVAVAGACRERLNSEGRYGDAHTDVRDRGPDDDRTAARLTELAARCQRLADEPEFGFLLHPRRRLFHIGYRVAEDRLDTAFYDLLASEARLASLWAIAKGDVPVSHWAALGRPFFAVGRLAGLRSWSGSMFEYLMPSLVLDEPPGSALDSAVHSALREQIAYGQLRQVPWGLSECAHAAVDHTLAYQYSPQGVPRLAMRRTPPDELVVAPYASALAAMFAPQRAMANLRALEGLHARGERGFIEALDYTALRQTDGSRFTKVSTWMAHHQGMTIVSLANVLLHGAPRRWAMADARLAAMAPLLQERVPRALSRLADPLPIPHRPNHADPASSAQRSMRPGEGGLQPTQLMSNGRYSVAIRPNGAGWSRLGRADLSRWRDDAPRDAHGTFLYLRRPGRPAPVSITQHPAADPAAHYQASFGADRVCLEARWPDLRTRCTVWVDPDSDVEFRRIELWNTSAQAMPLALMSMFEAALSDARADESHPAFSNLFVRARWDAETQAIHLSRQPRLTTEAGLNVVHFVARGGDGLTALHAQTDRAQWMGRNRDPAEPLAHCNTTDDASGERGTGLDPVAALAMHLVLPAHGVAELTLATAAATGGDAAAVLTALVQRCRGPEVVERSLRQSATRAAIRQDEMRLSSDTLQAIRCLTTPLALLLPRPGGAGAAQPWSGLAAPETTDGMTAGDRRLLWRFGVSGDRPLLVVSISAMHGLPLVSRLVRGLRWWSWGGLACDLVVVNGEPRSYLTPLQQELKDMAERHRADMDRLAPQVAACLVLLHGEDLTPAERSTLSVHARVRLYADGRPLAHQVPELSAWHDDAAQLRERVPTAPLPTAQWTLVGRPPVGRFAGARGGVFEFHVSNLHRPLRPWVNVLANDSFGTLVSETGAGCTWAVNSRMNQLTPWSNDPVTDLSGETFLVQDTRSGEVWNVAAGGGNANEVSYGVRHEPGLTTIGHQRGPLEISACWCVDPEHRIKQIRIRVRNLGTATQRLRIIGMVEWMMGAERADRRSIVTSQITLTGSPEPRQPHGTAGSFTALMATQCDGHAGFGGGTAYFAQQADGGGLRDWTCNRQELFNNEGRRVVAAHFGRQAGPGLDPCAAGASTMRLAEGQSDECCFLIGYADSPEAARSQALLAMASAPDRREAAVRAYWLALLGTVTVQTPDPLFDAMVNHWLLYQTVACRLWARAGFYQAGGAFGFRDQLQDAMALAAGAPGLLRRQLLLAASRQFPEGDVQHWWHPPTGAGVRTRMSDDLLWLPYAVLHHVAVSGDDAVLDEAVPFLEGQTVPEDSEDAYFVPQVSATTASLYEHCARTLDHSLAVGLHGLPLMGTGDWNDGMNRVGHLGRGESVWLGFFLCRLVAEFAPIAEARGDGERALRWEVAASGWRAALRGSAWDGEWFARAFFDDGSSLGSHTNTECRIDLIAQAWSVLSGVGTPEQQALAMASARRLLYDEPMGLVRLLDPPLSLAEPSAGYIQAYPPGVRENGGQYNHAGVWALMAQVAMGQGDAAFDTFTRLSPAHRAAHPQRSAVYGLEPYAIAADICTQPPYAGRGGWSWYTGSAGWLHRSAIESIFGMQLRGGSVCFRPCLPRRWPLVNLRLQRDGRVHEFTLCAANGVEDIARLRSQGLRSLPPGMWLQLALAGDASRHLVVVPQTP